MSRSSGDPSHATATITIAGVSSPVDFTIDGHGRLTAVRVTRWGKPPPDTKQFRIVDFGGVTANDRTFAGYTIPTRVRVGWHVGSPQFETDGEFFRATIDEAAFRCQSSSSSQCLIGYSYGELRIGWSKNGFGIWSASVPHRSGNDQWTRSEP